MEESFNDENFVGDKCIYDDLYAKRRLVSGKLIIEQLKKFLDYWPKDDDIEELISSLMSKINESIKHIRHPKYSENNEALYRGQLETIEWLLSLDECYFTIK